MFKSPAPIPLRALVAMTALFALSACESAIWALPPAADADAPRVVRTDTDYALNGGDTIKVSVYGEDSLTGQYVLDQRGQLTMPMAGAIDLAGMTRADAQAAIAKRLKAGKYLSHPLVNVDLVASRPVYILGEVKNPSAYPWQPGLDALNVVALAGGYTPRAARNQFLIDRTVTGPHGVQDHRHLNGSQITPVLPGDTVTVRERIF